MIKFLLTILFICSLHFSKAQTNMVSYIGSVGSESLYDVTQLSNGTFLVCGYAQDLSWVPSGVPINVLPSSGINNALDTMAAYGFIMQLSNDLQTILTVVHFPKSAVQDIRYLKFSSLPYSKTGDLFISGGTYDTKANQGGYYIAKLNNNFVNGVPNNIVWAKNIWAEGYNLENQPWDVGSDGKVVYMYGQSHAADWAQISRLNISGNEEIVSNWRHHWDATGAEYRGAPSGYAGTSTLVRSGIVLKKTGRCDLRSLTLADYNLWQSDGNGSMRKGKWPLDFLYNGPCNVASVSTSGPGYNGYKASSTGTYGGQIVCINRRTNSMYFGMNTKSILPGGNPDFEPAVFAMDSSGTLMWYSRLYHEVMPNTTHDTVQSSPDQYIDGLAIDYVNNNLIVNARCHGNNVSNFWMGNKINANPTASAFQNQYTGTNGNAHYSWLGKLSLGAGVLQASTFVAEYNNNANATATPLADPNMYNWPDPNAGWAQLNTTRITKNSLKVSSNGSVLIGAVGRHAMTTTNAYHKNVRPSATGATVSTWANFVRLYEPDFSKPTYSSLMSGLFDTITGANGDNTTVYGYYKTTQGIIGVGKQSATAGVASGAAIPTINVLPYGSATPSNESGIIFYYKSANMINLNDSLVNNLSIPLPISMHLNGYNKNSENVLTWEVSGENENYIYEVQHSLDGQFFKSISDKINTNINTINKTYTFTHSNATDGVNYYRILQAGANEEKHYTNIVKLFYDNPSGLNIYPNPSKNEVYINFTENNISYKIMDMLGKIITSGTVQNQYINLQQLPIGHYMLQLNKLGKVYNRTIEIN
jgi:Secretion system C-terminal sorting domain